MKNRQQIIDRTVTAISDKLLSYGLPADVAAECSNNIAQIGVLNDYLSVLDVYMSLCPSSVNRGIADLMTRNQAAHEVCRVWFAETSPTIFSALTGLGMIGDDSSVASDWLAAHGYLMVSRRSL